MEENEIEKRFSYHSAKESQQVRFEQIRDAAKRFAHLINDLCPEGREKSLAITSLEQAQFWANASIVRE